MAPADLLLAAGTSMILGLWNRPFLNHPMWESQPLSTGSTLQTIVVVLVATVEDVCRLWRHLQLLHTAQHNKGRAWDDNGTVTAHPNFNRLKGSEIYQRSKMIQLLWEDGNPKLGREQAKLNRVSWVVISKWVVSGWLFSYSIARAND